MSIMTYFCSSKLHKLHWYKIIAFILFFILILISAWICDDAYHGFSMSRNLVNGHGFVYNIGERVNATTMPLMSLLQAGLFAIVHNMFMAGILSGLLLSSMAFIMLLKYFCHDIIDVLLCLFLTLSSKPFISFTTSGLENPLLYLNVAFFFLLIQYIRKMDYLCSSRIFFFFGLHCSLVMMARMDNILYYAPAMLYLFFYKRNPKEALWKHCIMGILGLVPFIAWLVFSFVYYGFLLPNTAYAKLVKGIPLYSYLFHGITYIITSFFYSPITFVWILFVVILLLRNKDKNKQIGIFLAIGVILYMLYLLYIGGDFMAGRHLTIAFWFSIFAFLLFVKKSLDYQVQKKYVIFFLTLMLFPLSIPYKSYGAVQYLFRFSKDFNNLVIDERQYYTTLPNSYYFHFLSWCQAIRNPAFQSLLSDVPQNNGNGCYPSWYGIDHYHKHGLDISGDIHGLGDAYVVRCPLHPNLKKGWRVGHIYRSIPKGYNMSLKTGIIQVENSHNKMILEDIWDIIRGPIWSKKRFRKIIHYNFASPVCELEDDINVPINFNKELEPY